MLNFKSLGTIASLLVGIVCLLASNLVLTQIKTLVNSSSNPYDRGSWADQQRLLMQHQRLLPESPLRTAYTLLTAVGMVSLLIFLLAMIAAQVA